MPRFASFFRSGRSTPTPTPSTSYPSTSSSYASSSTTSIPATPTSADPSSRSTPTPTPTQQLPPSAFRYATPPSARGSTETLRSGWSVDSHTDGECVTDVTPVRARRPSRTLPSTPSHSPPKHTRSPSAVKLKSSMTSPPTNRLPTTLPPPQCALPPTPEASPGKRVSKIYLGPSDTSNKLDTPPVKLLPSTNNNELPPPSFRPFTIHARNASDSTPARRPSQSRTRSASTGTEQTAAQPQRQVSKIHPSARPASPPLHAFFAARSGASSPEVRHRPAALRLRTSNLSPPAKNRAYRRLPQLSQDTDAPSRPGRPDETPAPSASRPDLSRSGSAPEGSGDGAGVEELSERAGSEDSDHTLKQRPSIRRIESAEPVLRPLRLVERRRSRSLGDATHLIAVAVAEQQRQQSQREQGKYDLQERRSSLTIPGRLVQRRPSHKHTVSGSSSSSYTPSTALTDLSARPTLSSEMHTPNQPRPFDNIPLPWSTVPHAALRRELGQAATSALIDYTITHLGASAPSLLDPSILKTSVSEEQRLRSELFRLREKWTHLIHHRESLSTQIDSSLLKAEPEKMHKMFRALSKVVARCDRVSRQIFICNDQIRQIELQGQEHVVGALRVVLKEKKMELEHLQAQEHEQQRETTRGKRGELACSPSSSSSGGTFSSAASTIPATHAEVAAANEVTFGVPSSQLDMDVPCPTSPTTPNSKGNSPENKPDSRRTSTATILNVNHLTFPIPPSRRLADSPTSPTPFSAQLFAPGLEVEVEVEGENDGESTDSHTSTLSYIPTGKSGREEILIYPPGHHRSISAPLFSNASGIGANATGLDMPYTPWKSDTHETPSTSVQHGRSASESEHLTPTPQAVNSTAPLRVARRLSPNRAMTRKTAKSMSTKGSAMSEEKRREERQGEPAGDSRIHPAEPCYCTFVDEGSR